MAQYLAVAKPLETARVVAGPQLVFSMVFTPVIQLTNGTANWILRRLGIEPAEELSVGALAAGTGVTGAKLGPARRARTVTRRWSTARCGSGPAPPKN